MSTETDRIEADIAESRHKLNDTLSALGSKLSPGQLLDEVLGLAQGQAGQFTANLGRQVRDNPIPAILVGAGVAMLFIQKRGSHAAMQEHEWDADKRYRKIEEVRWRTPRLQNESDDAFEQRLHDAYVGVLGINQISGETADTFKDRVRDTVGVIERTAAGVRDRVAGAFAGARTFVETEARHLGEQAGAARHSVEDFYGENPIAAGAIAMAVGALIGGATPLSDTERKALSGIADSALEGGAKLAERTASAAQARVDSVH